MPILRLDAGDRTEELLQFITRELDDATLDQTEVQRKLAETPGLVSEPITLAATVTLTLAVIAGIVRLVERWMETQKQLASLIIVAEGFDKGSEAGKALTQLATTHANVSISYGLANESWTSG